MRMPSSIPQLQSAIVGFPHDIKGNFMVIFFKKAESRNKGKPV
jgi:hypothetical protein